jgi:hypothetical protein
MFQSCSTFIETLNEEEQCHLQVLTIIQQRILATRRSKVQIPSNFWTFSMSLLMNLTKDHPKPENA